MYFPSFKKRILPTKTGIKKNKVLSIIIALSLWIMFFFIRKCLMSHRAKYFDERRNFSSLYISKLKVSCRRIYTYWSFFFHQSNCLYLGLTLINNCCKQIADFIYDFHIWISFSPIYEIYFSIDFVYRHREKSVQRDRGGSRRAAKFLTERFFKGQYTIVSVTNTL